MYEERGGEDLECGIGNDLKGHRVIGVRGQLGWGEVALQCRNTLGGCLIKHV